MSALLAPPVADATRRQVLALLGVSGLLAGCGAEGSSTSPAGDVAAPPAIRSFAHLRGTTEVPVAPRRIVSLHSTFLTWQLATSGVLSIATSAASAEDPTEDIRLADPAAAAALDGLVSVDEGGEIALERVAALRPDLIVGSDYHDDLYDELSAIAPTVLIASDLPDGKFFGVQRALAGLTGTMPVLEGLHKEYDARVAALRERFRDGWAGLEWLVLDEIDGEGPVGLVNLDDAGPVHRVLTDLGAPLAASAQRYATGKPYAELSRGLVTGLDADVVVAEAYAAGGELQLSLERVGDLSADLIVVYNLGDADFTRESVFAALPAARAGQVVIRTTTLLAPEITDATRREFLALLGAAGLLAGCGSAEPSGPASAATRSVVDGAGRRVDVPADPQRVVVLDANRTIVNLVALGIEPAGATTNRTNPGGRFAPVLGEAGNRIEPVGVAPDVDIERVAAVNPDLIVTAYPDAVPLAQLEALAPTLVATGAQFTGGLFTNLRWVGEMTGRQDRARELEQEFLATIERRRPGVGLDGVPTVILVTAGDGYLAIAGEDRATFDLLALVGALDGRPDVVGGLPVAPTDQEIGAELIGEAVAGADALVIVGYRGDEADRDAVLASPLLRGSPAGRSGRIAVVDAQESAGNNGLPGLIATLDRIEATFAR